MDLYELRQKERNLAVGWAFIHFRRTIEEYFNEYGAVLQFGDNMDLYGQLCEELSKVHMSLNHLGLKIDDN